MKKILKTICSICCALTLQFGLVAYAETFAEPPTLTEWIPVMNAHWTVDGEEGPAVTVHDHHVPGAAWPVNYTRASTMDYVGPWLLINSGTHVYMHKFGWESGQADLFIRYTFSSRIALHVATGAGSEYTFVTESVPFSTGDNLIWHISRNWGVPGYGTFSRLYKNGEPIWVEHSEIPRQNSNGSMSIRASQETVIAPSIDTNPNLRVPIGSSIDWIFGISASWGHTSTNKIPPLGEITPISLVGGNDASLSADGITYSKIGSVVHFYEVRDDHSLSAHYPLDNTVATTSRKITVYTPASPNLLKQYAPTADTSLVGETYDPLLPLPCAGESGWTNQPLDISIDPDTIVGTFDTLLTLPDLTTTATNAIATRTNYHIESPNALGTPLSGVLTAIGDASNLLSGTVNGFVKIDKTNPIPAVTHVSGYNFTDDSTDALSGMSLTRPSKIAFSTPSGPQPAPGDFSTFDSIPSVPDGTYDVWVTATDKAGNTATERVLTDILLLNGTVELTKETDQGATLHIAGCSDADSVSVTSCTPECSEGANVEIEEKSALTYKLTLNNTDLADTASGTFEDYLPEGTIVTTMPTVTPAGSATVIFDLETTGPYTGRYKVSGTYTNLAPGGQIEIDILTRAPAFDKVIAMNNIISNQAFTNWTIGTDPTERTGSTDSNYAVHELTDIPSVETLFTKVGANDLDLGLTGAEFALYRWDGALDPTTAERNHIVDQSMLVDNTLAGGNWVRVKYDGEDATALTDLFTPASTPLGEVDLGELPEGIYTLIETKAPTGYALPMGQWILTIDPSKDDTGASDWKIDFVGKSNSIAPPAALRDESIPGAPTYKIINAEPFLIGLSGLSGTTGMLLTGFIIMAIATNAYLVRRHKQKEKQEVQAE